MKNSNVASQTRIILIGLALSLMVGCEEEDQNPSIPVPAPVAAFSGTPTSGSAPHSVSFYDLSDGEVTNRVWSFGDGTVSTAENPSHTYANSGSYAVTLSVSGPNGSDEESKASYINVVSGGVVNAAFSANTTSGNAPLTVSFTDQSTGSITSRLWSFGDGSTSSATNPIHTYSIAGSYSVSLTVTGTGVPTDTEAKSNFVVVTSGPPVAAFSANSTSGDAPKVISFTDLSTGTITSRTWSFGDGSTSSSINPTHTYTTAGTYTVTLTVVGPGGSDSEVKYEYIAIDQIITVSYNGPVYPVYSSIGPKYPNWSGGDREFDGNGPFVEANANLYGNALATEVWIHFGLHTVETKSDWTEAWDPLTWNYKLYSVPSGMKMKGFVGQSSVSFSYTDTDVSYDIFNYTLCDFWILGDTNGNDVGNTTLDDTHITIKNIYFQVRVGP